MVIIDIILLCVVLMVCCLFTVWSVKYKYLLITLYIFYMTLRKHFLPGSKLLCIQISNKREEGSIVIKATNTSEYEIYSDLWQW